MSAIQTQFRPSQGLAEATVTPRPAHGPRPGAERIEELLAEVEAFPDAAARALTQECLQSLLVFYGEGLSRLLHLVKNAKPDGERIYAQLLRDKTVRALLLIHGLHPVDLETRLGEALDKVRPYLQSHGGNVELLSLHDDVARLRLQGSCKSCPSSAVTLELAIRQAIEEACPDLAGLEVEGVDAASENPPEKISLTRRKPEWMALPSPRAFQESEIKQFEISGVNLFVCKTQGILYAYRNCCPACGMGIQTLKEGQLTCPSSHRYDAQKAGIGLDNPKLHLDPFPLLVEEGQVKVSVR